MHCICRYPTGVEAAARLATSPFAAEEFSEYPEATVAEVLAAFGRRGGEAGAKRTMAVRIACASLGVPTHFATAEGLSFREFAAAATRLQVLDALPAGATREQRRAALDKVADAFKCAGADGLKRHFVDADPKKGKRSLVAQHEHDVAYLRRGGHTLQTLREREAAPRWRPTEETRRRREEQARRRRREEEARRRREEERRRRREVELEASRLREEEEARRLREEQLELSRRREEQELEMSDEQKSRAALDMLRAKLRDPEQAGRDLLEGWTASRERRRGSDGLLLVEFCYQFTDPDGKVYHNLTAAAQAAAQRLSKETAFDAALWLAKAAPRLRTVRGCEVRRVGDASWRRFASQSDATRAFPELSQNDISKLIHNPSKVRVLVRGRFEARKVTEPAADEASSTPKLATVQLDDDDDDDAAPWSGPAPELGGEAPPQDASVAMPPAPQLVAAVAAPPVGAVAAPPVGAVAARPFGMGAATADARVPFGGALQELDAAVEVDAALVAPALDGALAAPAWPTPPPAAALDASAQLFGLDLDARSRQAAAPAPVVAAPALVSPVAAAASTKRPRDESPKSVAQSCVDSYQ